MTKEDLFNISPFNTLSQEEFNELFNISSIKHYNAGKIVFYENDSIDEIFFLIDGQVKVYKVDRFDNEVFLYSIKTTQLISSFFPCENSNYFANTECLKDSNILSINHKELKELFKKYSNIYSFFMHELLKNIKNLQYVVNRETVFDGTSKVAYMLAHSLDEFNSLKKQEIAYMLNIQPETLSRILAKLKRENIIETSNDGKVSIINITKLANILK